MLSKCISTEERFIIELLFSEEKISHQKIKKLNLESLIKIGSTHLILPVIYTRICKNRIDGFFERDFIDYLKSIYSVNRNRNIKLKKEINSLTKMLDSNKIEHVFLKGAAILKHDLYPDIGERMTGDIDFLIKKEMATQLEKILDKNNYHRINNYTFFNQRHLPRRVNKKKLFAIEAHTRLNLTDNNRESIDTFNKKLIKNQTHVPCLEDLYQHTILNWQVNDYAYSEFKYSYRCLLDCFLIEKRLDTNSVSYDEDQKIIWHHYIVKNLGIKTNFYTGKKRIRNKIRLLILRLFLKKNKLHNRYLSFTKYLRRIIIIPKQIFTFFINKGYRAHIFQKLRSS